MNYRKQSGVTLIEMGFGLLLLALTLPYMAELVKQQTDKATANHAALHMRMVGDATAEFVKDNFAAISLTATPVLPVKINVATLVLGGYLPASFNANNTLSQTLCALALEPVANQLNVLVVSTGGQAFSDHDLITLTSAIGVSGGALYTAPPTGAATDIIGSGGSYSFARGNFHNAGRTCGSAGNGGVNLVPGHAALALWFDQSDYSSGVLYREAIAGRPELNQMNTNLDMNGFDINNIADLDATGNFALGGNEVITGDSTAADYQIAGISSQSLSRAVTESGVYRPGDAVPKPICAAPLTQQVFIQPVMYSNRDEGGAIQAVQTWATNAGLNWVVHMRIRVQDSLDTAPSSPGDGWVVDGDFFKGGVNYGLLSVQTKCN